MLVGCAKFNEDGEHFVRCISCKDTNQVYRVDSYSSLFSEHFQNIYIQTVRENKTLDFEVSHKQFK